MEKYTKFKREALKAHLKDGTPVTFQNPVSKHETLEGTISIDKFGGIFLCSDDPNMQGVRIPDRKGHLYSYRLSARKGVDFLAYGLDVEGLKVGKQLEIIGEC